MAIKAIDKVLVLGASGYIGSQLIPRLLEAGLKVKAVSRHIEHLRMRVSPHPNLTISYLDLEDREATLAAVQGCDCAFFLVHGMAHGHDFIDYELTLAQNFCDSVTKSQLKHVIYVSALQPQSAHSSHLEARRKTGELLRQSPVPVTEIRAGVVIGPGSAAFEIMRDFVYNLPLIIAPRSADSRANPIALDNLNHCLLKMVEETPSSHRLFEAGGPDILSYREQLDIIARQAGCKRRIVTTPLLTPAIASHWLGLVTSVPSSIGQALLAGLEHDFVADNTDIWRDYPQPMIPYSKAVEDAIKQEGDFVRSQVWGFEPRALQRWQPGYGYYPKQTGAVIKTSASREQLWQVIRQLGSEKEGYFFANGLWRLREWLDVLFGGNRPVRRRPQGAELQKGDYIDSWKVIVCEPGRFISLLFGMKGPGLGRLEFTVRDDGHQRELEVNAWWHPQGFRGLLYWFAMMPAHLFIFKGMVRAIKRKAQLMPDN